MNKIPLEGIHTMTLLELYESTKKFSMRRADYAQNSNWVLRNVVPFKGTKTLLIQADCNGYTEKATHVVNIQFEGLNYVDEVPKNAEYKTLTYKDEEYHFSYPTVEDTNVKIRCSCSDFYYTWSYPDWKEKVLFGSKPKKYIRKTKTRPPRNPDQIPGMCKHIYQAISLLKVEDLLK